MIARAPASGYEISIYTTNLSPLVWVLLITSMGGSIFLLVFQALDEKSRENNWWLLALFSLVFSSLIVLLLPVLKGYYNANRGDALSHVGYIKDIVLMGHFSEHNIYPVQHMVPAALSHVLGLSARTTASFVLPLFSAGYVLFIYLLAKTLFQRKGEIMLACIAGAILLIPHSGLFTASGVAALMFPLILALFFRSWQNKSFDYKLLFILILILHPYLHPMATFIMMAILVLVSLLQAGYNATHKGEAKKEIPLNYIFILAIVSFLWYVDLFIFKVGARFFVKLLTWETVASPANMYGSLLEKGGVHGFGIIELFFRFYGGEIIYGIVAAIAVLIVARKMISHGWQMSNMVVLSLLFVTFCFFYLILWLGLAIGQGQEYSRIISYIPVVSIVLATPILYQILHKFRYKKLVTTLLACLILTSAVLSVFNKYLSPYLYNPNHQATYMDIHGAKWIFNYRDPATKSTYTGTSLYRFAVAGRGIYQVHQGPTPFDPTFPNPPTYIPDHFGYQSHETIGESVTESVYLVLTEYDRVLYEEVWKSPIPTRWEREDFAMLENDPTADRLYANGEFDVWFVRPLTSTIPKRQA